MRLIDRLLVILAGLLIIAIITVVVLVPQSIVSVLESIESVNLLLRLALVVILNVIILVTIYMRLRDQRGTINGLEVNAPGAFTDVSIDSAQSLILNAVTQVPNVTAANATVEAVNGRADVDLNVTVTGREVNIPQKQKEINRALRQVINKQLGLRMRGKPRVHIILEESKSPAAGAAKPQPVVTPVPAEPATSEKSINDVVKTSTDKEDKNEEEQAQTDEPNNDDWLNSYLTDDAKKDSEKTEN